MINAEKARMISQKRGIKLLAKEKKEEIRVIKSFIKEAAKYGYYHTYYSGSLYDETKEWLKNLGYSIDRTLSGDTNISWRGDK